MAEHKVPQDVEADDKLIGPFSFRQFVYLMIAAAAGFLAFILWQIVPVLAIIPAPVLIFFLVLALPLRKDQPMEIYLAALVKYYFKPRVRIWQADGEESLVEISNPIVEETVKVKDLAGDEVSRRLSFLANLSDTQGWSTRGLSAPINNTNLNDEFATDAANTVDIMENNYLSDNFEQLLDASEQKVRNNAINMMNNALAAQQAQEQQINQYFNNQSSITVPARPTTQSTTQSQSNYQLPPQPVMQPTVNNYAVPTNTINDNGLAQLQAMQNQSANRQINLQTSTPEPAHNRQLQPISASQPIQAVKPVEHNKPINEPVITKNTTELKQPVKPIEAKPIITKPAKPAIIKEEKPIESSKPKTHIEDDIIDIKLH